MDNLDLQYLRRLSTRKKFTKEEKETLKNYAEKYGKRINKNCPNCWHDLIVQLYKIAQKENAPQGGMTAGGYQLKAGTDFMMIVGGRHFHVCDKNLTDASAAEWLRYGLSRTHFAKLPESNEEKTETEEKEQAQEDADNREDEI